ncbi:acyl-CoA dehydrogenase family protein [Oricola indica]|jgi:alkylation response protein AidB-like acyl-CoA dehydrogenase|uniref:acyl-CoA dehydrogenase family protein n=1 Tax=Oricola indica TaxID=2872591 RepID=UPI001CBD7C36|nr:acyl-CoA dehydrogenase family protein [Oricola indica]
MDFAISDEQKMLVETVATIMQRHASAEEIGHWDAERSYPEELYSKWAEAGLIQLPFPEEYGGLGGDASDVALLVEEISKHSSDLCMPYSSAIFCGLNILRNGTEAQKQHWLPKILSGEQKMLIGISEPGAGSDATAMTTHAVREGDHYRINGQKLWVTGAGLKDAMLSVYLKTDRTVSHREGVSLFLIDSKAPGVRLRKLDMLGRRCSGTYEVFFTDALVPAENLIGGEGHGWQCLMSGLQYERAVSAASSCGGAQGVVDLVTAYVKERVQFGRPIGTFQAIAHRIADMQTQVDAARMLTLRAIWLSGSGANALREISEAKLFASETYVKVAAEGVQLMGAYGLSREYAMERHYRDARSATIAAGTSETLRNLIAALMGLKSK